MDSETKSKIEAHIRKHRKSGGRAEAHEMHAKGAGSESADKGRDEAEEDIRDKPADRSFPGGGGKRQENVGKESEEKAAKKGGRIKRKSGGMAEKKEVGHVMGEGAHHHAGRKKRASGGACENSPFTTALKGSRARDRKMEKETKGASV